MKSRPKLRCLRQVARPGCSRIVYITPTADMIGKWRAKKFYNQMFPATARRVVCYKPNGGRLIGRTA